MSPTTTETTIEEIRRVHNQQPPSTTTKLEWEHIDFLLAEVDRLKAEVERLQGEQKNFSDMVTQYHGA